MDQRNLKKLAEIKELIKASSSKEVESKISKEIVSSLRNGAAPNKGIMRFSVGRENILKEIKRELNEVENGKSKLRFINGTFGSGKTHILLILKEFAFENNFASTHLTLSPRECPLSNLEIVYKNIVKGLRTKKCKDFPALEVIIKDWINRLYKLGQHNFEYTINRLKAFDPDFKNVLTCFIESSNKGLWHKADQSIRWIQGDVTTKKECKSLGACTYVCDETSLYMLQNVILMLKLIGFKGLVILFDEAESISSIRYVDKMQKTFDNLWRLINCNLETSHTYFIYATTPSFFESIDNTEITISDRNISKLDPLPVDALKKLGLSIRDMHIQSYNWPNTNRIRNTNVLRYVDKLMYLKNDILIARDFVRTMVASLDVCQQNPKLNC